GLEHVEAASRDRPLLLVANHRSFFDMYAVSTVLFRNTRWRKQLFFPVRGRFFYQSPLGLLVNLIMGWWPMYPPFFRPATIRFPRNVHSTNTHATCWRISRAPVQVTSSVFTRKARGTRATIHTRTCVH